MSKKKKLKKIRKYVTKQLKEVCKIHLRMNHGPSEIAALAKAVRKYYE